MKVIVRISSSFRVSAKPLLKKFPSLKNDLLLLQSELMRNPTLGTPLGHNAYKIRLQISSKGKGKSGGARVISLVQNNIIAAIDLTDDYITATLLIIYDKSEIASISDKELKDLIKKNYREE